MEDKFLLIGITPQTPIPDEGERITTLLESDSVDYLHLRHPDADAPMLAAILDEIPSQLYPRITLHDHFQLTECYAIGGVHLNERNPHLPPLNPLAPLRISRSCHSIEELLRAATYSEKATAYSSTAAVLCTANTRKPEALLAYATLSPIFDSISKNGYASRFTPDTLRSILPTFKSLPFPVIALGGVTPASIPLLRDLGFGGAAMLGALWQ